MAILKKEIKQSVTKLDTSEQLKLFTEPIKVRLEPEKPLERPCFINPDPKDIKLGEQRLDEHLVTVKKRNAFVVRKQPEALDFSKFEASYRSGGRPPYASQCMLGIILYGIIKGVSSLRYLEKLARVDLGCM